ncbi:MAG: BatD family protein [Bacteroidales bacterium]|nr:BatD family protein [Bacteroidales bacterium]
MKRVLICAVALMSVSVRLFGQNSIRVEAPGVVAADEQFNVTFVIEGEKSPSNFSWDQGNDFQLVWGPQKGSSTSIQIINGKKTSSHQVTYTYILMPKSTGTFTIPEASAKLDGERIVSNPVTIQVVTDGASQPQQPSSSGSSGQGSSSMPSSGSSSQDGEVSGGDVFMRLSLSRSQVVLGEPVTAVLKLYQRVDIAGFENAKFPNFNGFWSQETYAPTNIEFKRETLDDKIYNTAVLRSWVLIPQQAGTLTIDASELVCLVNVRASARTSNSIFDSFFQDDYKTIRKRVTAPAVNVKVSQLPAGQPASFGGGVGNFEISAHLTADALKTHDAASLVITVSGRGNVALLEEPEVVLPPDFESYDTKTTESTDKGTGGTSGSKTFEFPFIPRSAGEFTIEPVEYSYYDVNQGRYVTLRTEPLTISVEKGKGGESSSQMTASAPGVERKDVKSLADDIRFISTSLPSFRKADRFFVGSPLFLILLAILLAGSVAVWSVMKKVSQMKADTALTRNRKATKMARKRLSQVNEYLGRNLSTAFYEELHKTLLGFASDKLSMDMSEMSKDNIVAALSSGGVSEDVCSTFADLIDKCEFARYSPESSNEAMKSQYESAVEVVSAIDSSFRSGRPVHTAATVIAVLLCLGGISTANATPVEDAWKAGVQAYNEGRFADARESWETIVDSGTTSPVLYYNLGNAFFKEGNYPRAIICYERALKADPSYSDARYNLELTNGFIQDKIEPVPEFILKSLARKVSRLMGSDAWAVTFLVLLAMTLALLLMFLLGRSSAVRRTGFYTGLAILLLSLMSLGFSLWQKSEFMDSDSAVVTATVSSVKSSPSGNASKDLFIIHEGTKVRILDSVDGWDNISLADGRQGWIKAGDIEAI